jgi:kynurenine formamidase
MNYDYEIIDVCHTIHDGMITYKGLPPPVISDHLTRERSRKLYAPGTEFHIGKIEMVANTGTYLDSPFHRYPEGTDLAGLSLYSLANLEGVVIRQDADAPRAITASALSSYDLNRQSGSVSYRLGRALANRSVQRRQPSIYHR